MYTAMKSVRLAGEIDFFNLDFLGITETWQRFDSDNPLREICGKNYNYVNEIRHDKSGGGVAIIFRNYFDSTVLTIPKFSSFEHLTTKFSCKNLSLTVTIIYRPPSLSLPVFLDEFGVFLDLCFDIDNHLILGDFNIHVDCPSASYVDKFLSLLHQHSLIQHVSQSTHNAGHILDLVISRSCDQLVNSVSVFDIAISDHAFVYCSLNFSKTNPPRTLTTFRNWKLFDIDYFRSCTEDSFLFNENFLSDNSSPDTLFEHFNTISSSLLNEHAPFTQRLVRARRSSPWYTREISLAKKKRRQLESRWRKTRSSFDRDAFVQQRNLVSRIVHSAKIDYYKRCLTINSSPRHLWFSLNDVLGNVKNAALPSFDSATSCANAFSESFTSKIVLLRDTLSPSCIQDDIAASPTAVLSVFDPVSDWEVTKLLCSVVPKTCSLDPIPSWLLKNLRATFAPVICHLVNVSLSSGTLPSSEKRAIITPVLKKNGVDKNILSNYRPISGLSFLSKLIERIVCKRLTAHLDYFSLLPPFQSAYRKHFSTETALAKFLNDLMLSSDCNRLSFVVLLDLSSAFDTIDHSILFDRLCKRFGIRDTALSWLKSFLTGRSASVRIKSSFSRFSQISCGVPQGSVLGPLLFSMYVTPISDIISEYGLQHIIYADDITIYVSCNLPDLPSCLHNLQMCITHVVDWLTSNRLKINVGKTVAFLCGPKRTVSEIKLDPIEISGTNIPVLSRVKLLGVAFDSSLRFNEHVADVRRKCFLQLRNLFRIRKFVNESHIKTLIHSFVFSHVDYCNVLFSACNSDALLKLQRVIYSAARLVRRLPRHHRNMSHVIKDLGWLSVRNRIMFKVCCFVHRIVHGSAPYYLQTLVSPAASHTYTSHLRSHSSLCLNCPISSSVRAQAAFCFSAPRLWNSLPVSIKNIDNYSIFKRVLKEYLL